MLMTKKAKRAWVRQVEHQLKVALEESIRTNTPVPEGFDADVSMWALTMKREFLMHIRGASSALREDIA